MELGIDGLLINTTLLLVSNDPIKMATAMKNTVIAEDKVMKLEELQDHF